MFNSRRFLSVFSVVFLMTALAACSGDKSVSRNQPPPSEPPPAQVDPTAAITAPDSATALDAVVLDASNSASSDGSALQYIWDFGNGQRGGGVKITHLFAAAGTQTVTLTVIDTSNRSATATKSISIAAPSAAVTQVTAKVLVKGLDAAPISGVTVAPAAAASAATDASGTVTVTVNAGGPTTLKFSKSGLADQFLNIDTPAGVGNDSYFEVVMRARDAALTLADVSAGGTLTGRDGASITVPANAFIDASGATVSGAAQISVTPVDVTQAGAGGFPGGFEGFTADGTKTSIVSLGVNEFVPTANGAPLQLAPGKSATITIPVYASLRLDGTPVVAGDSIPLWSLDEATGLWIQEGSGTIVASTDSPSGLAMSAVVTHLSWWNSDLGFDPYGPQPNCEGQGGVGIPGSVDTFVNATICNMLAEIDHGLDNDSTSGTNGTALHAKTQTRAAKAQQVKPTALTAAQLAAYSRQFAVAIPNVSKSIPVPPNVDVRLTAYALNGTWTGTTVVHGAVGVQEGVTIPMHPVGQTAGNGAEAITLPFDGNRVINAGTTAQFTFHGTAKSVARISVAAVAGSNLGATATLSQGSTVISTATINSVTPGNILGYLPTDGTYTLTVAKTDNQPTAGFHLTASLEVSNADPQAITLPFDGVRAMVPNGTADFTFSGTANTYVHVTLTQNQAPYLNSGAGTGSAMIRVLQNGNVVASTLINNTVNELYAAIGSGPYTLEIVGNVGATFELAAALTGATQTGTLTLPSDVTTSLAAYNTYVGTFTLGATTGIYFDARRTDGDLTDVKLLAADGSTLFEAPPYAQENEITNSFVAALPAGTYSVQIKSQTGLAATERVTLATTPWVPVAPTLQTAGLYQLVDLVLDHANKPVVFYIDRPIVGNTATPTLKIRRLKNADWETVAADLVLGASFCGQFGGASLVFDLNNDPVVTYGQQANDGSGSFSVHRYSGGAWADLGANGGQLPLGSPGTGICDHSPRVVIGADNAPIAAYLNPSGVAVQRFDGTSWKGLVTPAGDLFGDFGTLFDLQYDPSGKLWLVTGTSQNTASPVARRFNTGTHVWDTIGGAWPQIGTIGLQEPKLRFDSHGSPLVAWLANVGSNGVSSYGTAVYRFDGTQWSTTGGYEPTADSYGGGLQDPAFTVFNDQAIVAFTNTDRAVNEYGTVVVQTSTATGYTPIGGGIGKLPQYSYGLTPIFAASPHLVNDGTDVYLALIANRTAAVSVPDNALTLLKKVGN